MKQAYRGILILFTLTFSLSSHAALLFTSNLDGSQEVPTPVVTPATGFGSVLLSDDQTNITVSLFFSGLSAPQTGAHIHGPALPGVNAPIVFGLPLGQITNAVFSLTPAQISIFTNELFYFNVHSQRFPGGEIRGQIRVVPEPAILFLITLGFAGMMWARKKMR